MSICTRVGNNLSWAASCAWAGASRIGRFTSGCARVIYKIGNSTLGRKSILAIRENVAEFVAYYAGAELAAPYGKRAGAKFGELAGKTTIVATACIAGKGLVYLVSHTTSRLSPRAQNLISATVFLAAGGLVVATISNPLILSAAAAGELLGEYLTYYGSGIVCAFFAIKLSGSEEIFWQSSSKIKTYPVKTIISMAGTLAVNARFPLLQNDYTQPITDLALGSLIYNSLDLAEAYLKIRAGRFLDGVLVRQLPDPGAFEILLRAGSHQLVDLSVEQLTTATILKRPSFLCRLLPDIVPTLQRHLKDLADRHLDPAAPALSCLRTLTEKEASAMIMRGANLYMAILERYPDAFSKAETALACLQSGATALTAMQAFDPLRRARAVYQDFRNHPLTVILQEFSDIPLDIFQQDNISLPPLDLPKFITPENIESLTENLMLWIRRQEEELCGFPLSGDRERQKIHTCIENHLENIIRCAILCAPSIPVPLSESEGHNFYANLFRILPDHYSDLLGKSSTGYIAQILKHQAKHSELGG